MNRDDFIRLSRGDNLDGSLARRAFEPREERRPPLDLGILVGQRTHQYSPGPKYQRSIDDLLPHQNCHCRSRPSACSEYREGIMTLIALSLNHKLVGGEADSLYN